MAVAMEVAAASWRGGAELGGSSSSSTPVRKKRAWGADAQQLMQLMMGQLQHSSSSADRHVGKPPADDELTLDLLGKADDPQALPTRCAEAPKLSQSPEFLHLDPEDSAPLPSGWEKCLDLQTGKLYYVNKSSGVNSFNDPRKQRNRGNNIHVRQEPEVELQTLQDFPYEFLGSKKSETLRQDSLKAGCSTSSSSGSPRPISCRLPSSFPNGSNKLWSLQRNDRHNSSTSMSPGVVAEVSNNLELDLNLAAGGRSSPASCTQQAVCTMEMIQNALKRSGEQTSVMKRVEIPRLRLNKPSLSSSFSSLTNSATIRTEPSGASPSTSSSSTSASSRSSLPGASGSAPSNPASTTGVCEADSNVKVENVVVPSALVMGACTRCLMYVMLNKADPRCPRCESKVPVDFNAAAAPPCKKQRAGGLKLGSGSSM